MNLWAFNFSCNNEKKYSIYILLKLSCLFVCIIQLGEKVHHRASMEPLASQSISGSACLPELWILQKIRQFLSWAGNWTKRLSSLMILRLMDPQYHRWTNLQNIMSHYSLGNEILESCGYFSATALLWSAAVTQSSFPMPPDSYSQVNG